MRPPSLPRSVWIVAAVYLSVQLLLLFAYDAHHPAAFLSGDRSDTRMLQIEAMLRAEFPSEFTQGLLTSGLPGDYLWQMTVFKAAEFLSQPRLGVVMVQILLQTLSIIVTGLLGVHLQLPRSAITLGAVLYASFPHSIAFPHMLISEAFFAPFVLFATYFTVRYAQVPRVSRFGLMGGATWTLAALSRPEGLLAPFVAALVLLAGRRVPFPRAALFLAAYLIPLAAWVVPSLALTGNPNLSNRRPDQFNRLMHSKAEYLVLLLPPEEAAMERARLDSASPERFRPSELLAVYARHPWKAAQANGLEAATLLLKFGETKLLNYFGIWDTDGSWRADLYALSPLEFARKHATLLPIVVGGAMVWFVILLAFGYGVVGLWKNPDGRLVLFLVLYALCAALVTDTTQARMRYCVDYAFALFGAAGFIRWRSRKSPRDARIP
jgi:hypothetical protein